MKNKLFFCADLGTSSLKAALIDSSGSLHAFTRVSYTGVSNEKQSDADSWLHAFYIAAEQLAAMIPPELCPVSAIVISGNGPTLAPVTGEKHESSETLSPIYWHDQGSPLPGFSSLFLPKVKFFIDAFPPLFAKVKFFFSPQEWLSWKLGARPVTVIPHNGYVPYYWDEEQCTAYGISKALFPPFVKMGEVIGECNAAFTETAVRLIAPGTPIIGGGADFIMALIGTGTLEPGMACNRTGSSEGINLCIAKKDRPEFSGKSNVNDVSDLRLLPHAMEGLWNLGVVIHKSGCLFDEYRIKSSQNNKTYNELTEEILANPNHPGKPILEEMGRNFVNALEDLERALPQTRIKELVLSGGQCHSAPWNQYKATISGRILKIPEIIHAELAGNAVLAAAALDGGSISEKAAEMIRIKERYLPYGL